MKRRPSWSSYASYSSPPTSNDRNRPSYSKTSTHQTFISKSLYEHALGPSTIAAVASISPTIRNSSLGPNLLALIEIDTKTIDLFISPTTTEIFSPSTTLQFTNTLEFRIENSIIRERIYHFIVSKMNSTPYFSRSLKKLTLVHPSDKVFSLFEGFPYLEHVDLKGFENCHFTTGSLRLLATLPKLRHFGMFCPESRLSLTSAFWKKFGNLTATTNPILESIHLDVLPEMVDDSDHDRTREGDSQEQEEEGHGFCVDHIAFRKYFVDGLCAGNRLKSLFLPDEGLNMKDYLALENCGMTNLDTFRGGAGFKKFPRLREFQFVADAYIGGGSGEGRITETDLVELANTSPHLEKLELICVHSFIRGSFLSSPELNHEAFGNLKYLRLSSMNCRHLSDAEIGDGFKHLPLLEHLWIGEAKEFNGMCFEHLEGRFLTLLAVESPLIGDALLIKHVSRFSSLKILWIAVCTKITSRGLLEGVINLEKLEHITLSGCHLIEPDAVTEFCKRKNLSGTNKLKVIGFNHGVVFKEDHVREILENCPNLDEISFNMRFARERIGNDYYDFGAMSRLQNIRKGLVKIRGGLVRKSDKVTAASGSNIRQRSE